MKTICRLEDFVVPNVSLYLYPDTTEITILDDRTIIGDPANPELYIMDCTISNCVLKENVTDPGEWFGWKYTYTDADGWELNPNWEPPQPPPALI